MKNKKKKKNIIGKEIFIFILLLILIMLILIVSLYDFIPNDISVQETISYSSDSTTTKIKQEIAYTNNGDSIADTSSIDSTKGMDDTELITSLKSYKINASDLEVYGQKKLYNSGNANPFDYATEDETTDSSGENSSGNTDSTSGANASNQSSSTGTFFEKKNSK